MKKRFSRHHAAISLLLALAASNGLGARANPPKSKAVKPIPTIAPTPPPLERIMPPAAPAVDAGPSKPLRAAAQPAVDASNRFGCALFQKLAANGQTANVFFSPTSVYEALSLAAEGSAGATQAAMFKGLGEPTDAKSAAVNAANAALTRILATQNPASGVTLAVANALWSDTATHFAPSFIADARTSFGATVQSLNFSQPTTAAAVINHWVAVNTRDKITQLVSPGAFADKTGAVLTNAVYFKGKWADPFEKSATEQAVFHRPAGAGGDKSVPMMSARPYVVYLHTEAFDAVRLPYQGKRYAFYAFLPARSSSVDAFMAGFDAKHWGDYQMQLAEGAAFEVAVKMPRFKMAFEKELTPPLKQLGMGIAFTSDADFRPMGLGRKGISAVVHKAVLEVNEEGAEAAAATAVAMMTMTASPFARELSITLDRPFVGVIADDATHAILFAGIVNDPQ